MDTAVRARPNHYQTLGLEPTASSEEIERAFARAISVFQPRAFGGLAEVGIAYETLKDPSRRRAYDDSIGLRRDPPPPPEPRTEWTPFLVRASARPAEPAREDAKVTSAPSSEIRPKPQPEPEVAPRPVPEPIVREPIAREPVLRPEPAARAKFEQSIREDLSLRLAEEHRRYDAHIGPAAWKRPALIVAGLTLGVGLLGAGAGLVAARDIDSSPPDALTVKVPPARTLPAATGEPPASISTQPEPRTHAFVAAARTPRTAPALRTAPAEEQTAQVEEMQPEVASAEPAVADESPAEVTPAKLPLSNAVIARTIGRIGYPCGGVASATAMGAGAFNVTCTSGHSYRAAPVNGRYRFRRLGR